MKKSLLILPVALGAAFAQAQEACVRYSVSMDNLLNKCFYAGLSNMAEGKCYTLSQNGINAHQNGGASSVDVNAGGNQWQETTCVGVPSSSSTATESSSSTEASSASTATSVNIDDFEEGAGKPAKTGTNDYWYAYADGTGSSIGNAADGNGGKVVNFDASTCGSSSRCAGITNAVVGTDGSVALGVDFAGGLPGCTAISYRYKGAAHNLKAALKGDQVKVGDKTESVLTGWNQHYASVNAASDWTQVTISKGDIKQEKDWGTAVELVMANVSALKWEIKKVDGANYLYIDDVNCVGYDPSAANSSSSVTGTAVVIDDFDDGNTTAESLGATAYWYLYTAGGSYSNTKDNTTGAIDMIVKDGTNSYAAMKDISGITPGSDKQTPPVYASVGMEVAFSSGLLSGCSAIQYDYKGSGHRMRATVDGVKADQGWEHVATDQSASTGWKTVTVSTMAQTDWVSTVTVATLVNFSWAKVSRLTWVVDEKFSAANLGTELDIDNVKCVGTLGTASPTSSNSNSIAMTSAAPAGLNVTLMGNTLQVTVAKAGVVKVQVFDMMGHVIEGHSENMSAGSFAHSFGAMSKGFYVVRVQQGSLVKTLRMQVR